MSTFQRHLLSAGIKVLNILVLSSMLLTNGIGVPAVKAASPEQHPQLAVPHSPAISSGKIPSVVNRPLFTRPEARQVGSTALKKTPTPQASPTASSTPSSGKSSLQLPMTIQTLTQNKPLMLGQAMVQGQQTPIAGGPDNQHSPAVAYNSTWKEFLAVWVDDNTSPASLRGRRLANNGTPKAAEFHIANMNVGTPFWPYLAYNSVSNSYLVIWSEANGSISNEQYCADSQDCWWVSLSTYNLYALPLAADGSPATSYPTLLTNVLTFMDTENTCCRTAYDVAYNPQANEFVAVWEQPRGALVQIGDNTYTIDQNRVVAQRLGPDALMRGASQAIAIGAVSDIRLGFSTVSGLYLVMFDRWAYNYDLYGQMFASDLTLSGGMLTFTYPDPGDQIKPNLTYLPSDNTYLMVWFDNRNFQPDNGYIQNKGDVRGMKISAATGAVLGPEVVLLSAPSKPFDGYWVILDSYNSAANQILVAADQTTNPNFVGLYVDTQGNPQSNPFPIASSVIEWEAASMQVSGSANWLAVWNNSGDIYGQTLLPWSKVFDGSVVDPGGGNCDCAEGAAGDATPHGGDPINLRTGGLSYQVTDLSIPTSAGSLSFERSYSSSATSLYNTTLGYGWTHNLDLRLIFPTDPGGQAGFVFFKAHSADLYQFIINSDGTYSPAQGVEGALTCTGTSPVVCTLILPHQETYSFSNSKLQSWQDGSGHTATYSYDANGNVNKVADDSGNHYLTLSYTAGQITSVSDQTGRSVSFGYDTSNNLATAKDVLNGTWQYQYDGSHRLTQVLDPSGQTTQHTDYDTQGRAFRQYDGNGKQTLLLTFNANGTTTVQDALTNITTYTFDDRNTLTGVTDPTSAVSSKAYDPNFRPATLTDAGGNTTNLTWATNGTVLTTIQDAAGGQTNLTYDALSNVKTVLDPLNNLTTFNYSGNLPINSTDALNETSTYTYTSQGYLQTVQDPLGHVTKYTYDTYGNRTSVIQNYDPSHGTNEQGLYNLTTTYTYDDLGNQLTSTDPLGQVTKNQYDAAGRLVQVTRNYDSSRPQNDQNLYNIVTAYQYDTHGNQIAVTDTYGVITRTYYDTDNRPVTVVRNLTGQAISVATPPTFNPAYPDQNVRSDTVYDDAGNTIATIDTNGVITRTFYDADNRPVTVVQNLTGQAISVTTPPTFSPTYPDQNVRTDTVYDTAGHNIATIDTNGKITRTYYDSLNRPVTVVQDLVGQTIQTATPPSRGGSLATNNLRTDTVYDAAGNVIATIDPMNSITRTYYDALNRP